MSLVLTVSTLTRELSTRLSLMVALVMKPVRPMPPAVAQNSSGSASWVTVCGAACSAFGKRMSKLVTWLANDPATWWFLPCTSAAIAPPTVTWRVPGETGHEPAVRQPGDHELLKGDAGLRDHDAGGGVEADDVVQPAGGDDGAARGLRRVVVAAAEAARDRGAALARGRLRRGSGAGPRPPRRWPGRPGQPGWARCGPSRSGGRVWSALGWTRRAAWEAYYLAGGSVPLGYQPVRRCPLRFRPSPPWGVRGGIFPPPRHPWV